jgi:hypothetical protein
MLDVAKIQNLMTLVYDQLQSIADKAANTEARRQFVFHMTDWIGELERLVNLYQEDEPQKAKAAQTVAAFLYHAIPHLNTAGRLLLDYSPDGVKREGDPPTPS